MFTGRIDTFRVLPAARGRPKGKYLWQVNYPEALDDPTEELDDVELAKALAHAAELGVSGP